MPLSETGLFRSTLINGHSQSPSACLKGAKMNEPASQERAARGAGGGDGVTR